MARKYFVIVLNVVRFFRVFTHFFFQPIVTKPARTDESISQVKVEYERHSRPNYSFFMLVTKSNFEKVPKNTKGTKQRMYFCCFHKFIKKNEQSLSRMDNRK